MVWRAKAQRHWYKDISKSKQTCLTGRAKIEGLAVDSERQKLYFADSEYEVIGEMSTNGRNYRVLKEIYGSRLRAIVLDSVNR